MIANLHRISGNILRRTYRRAMRNCALLVHDIDLARRHNAPAPGDPGLREQMLRQAILWRDRAARVNWRCV